MGWFGGQGMDATIQNYSRMGFTPFLTYLSSYTEFIGGFLMIAGLATRPAAIAIIINMFVATKTMWPHGFLFGGAAYPFLVLVSFIVIMMAGPMAYSLDSLLFNSSGKIP